MSIFEFVIISYYFYISITIQHNDEVVERALP